MGTQKEAHTYIERHDALGRDDEASLIKVASVKAEGGRRAIFYAMPAPGGLIRCTYVEGRVDADGNRIYAYDPLAVYSDVICILSELRELYAVGKRATQWFDYQEHHPVMIPIKEAS